jgi:DNA-binding NtrC family response regulator
MNAMSGFELSHRMIAERPNIRVLLYSANPAYAGQTEFPFLAKPFVPEQLQIAVGRALESQAETAAPADLELSSTGLRENSSMPASPGWGKKLQQLEARVSTITSDEDQLERHSKNPYRNLNNGRVKSIS